MQGMNILKHHLALCNHFCFFSYGHASHNTVIAIFLFLILMMVAVAVMMMLMTNNINVLMLSVSCNNFCETITSTNLPNVVRYLLYVCVYDRGRKSA